MSFVHTNRNNGGVIQLYNYIMAYGLESSIRLNRQKINNYSEETLEYMRETQHHIVEAFGDRTKMRVRGVNLPNL